MSTIESNWTVAHALARHQDLLIEAERARRVVALRSTPPLAGIWRAGQRGLIDRLRDRPNRAADSTDLTVPVGA